MTLIVIIGLIIAVILSIYLFYTLKESPANKSEGEEQQGALLYQILCWTWIASCLVTAFLFFCIFIGEAPGFVEENKYLFLSIMFYTFTFALFSLPAFFKKIDIYYETVHYHICKKLKAIKSLITTKNYLILLATISTIAVITIAFSLILN